jgi:hypothetical protein
MMEYLLGKWEEYITMIKCKKAFEIESVISFKWLVAGY